MIGAESHSDFQNLLTGGRRELGEFLNDWLQLVAPTRVLDVAVALQILQVQILAARGVVPEFRYCFLVRIHRIIPAHDKYCRDQRANCSSFQSRKPRSRCRERCSASAVSRRVRSNSKRSTKVLSRIAALANPCSAPRSHSS